MPLNHNAFWVCCCLKKVYGSGQTVTPPGGFTVGGDWCVVQEKHFRQV